jgi:heptosyltransferase-2
LVRSVFVRPEKEENGMTMRTGILQPLPGVGDMVWLAPALRAVAAHTDTPILLFAKKSAQASGLFAGEAWCGEVCPLPAAKRGLFGVPTNLWQLAQSLRAAKLDQLFILHHSPRYRLAARLAGIRVLHAYPRDIAKMKDNGWVKSLAMLDRLRIAVADRSSHLMPSSAALAAIDARFAAYLRPWHVVAVGASEEARRWPTERFAACADALIASGKACTVFVTGSPAEAGRVADVVAACANQAPIVAAADLPFDQFVALTARSAGLLGNDSGPANVAAALGLPAYTLCGVSKPAAHSAHLRLIEPDQAQPSGMESISVAHVLRALGI